MLKPLVGLTKSFVKDSSSFVIELKDIKLDPGDILVSFDVAPLYTNIPINEATKIIKCIIDPNMAKLVEMCLISAFFKFNEKLYKKTCGVAMGSPLSLVVANMFMKYFESKALASGTFNLKLWKRFVDDTCVIWSHDLEKLDNFSQHLNNQCSSINFTMECEIHGTLPFLDVLISKKDYGSFSHRVFQKKTHIEKYLHAKSHHFFTQNLGVLNTLATQVLRVFDKNYLKYEKNHLNVFNNNGYSRHQCLKAFLKADNSLNNMKEPKDRFYGTHLPFIQGTTNKIVRVLRKHKVPHKF